MLAAHSIDCVLDVRAFPGSRRLPHFGKDALRGALREGGIDYEHLRSLGGRRSTSVSVDDAVGGAWRNASSRAYAGYTRTGAYQQGPDELLARAGAGRVVIMCSEAVPWRCHRWLVSDTALARDADIVHILSASAVRWPGPMSSAKLSLGERMLRA